MDLVKYPIMALDLPGLTKRLEGLLQKKNYTE